jgi:pSer/pThr/pTyr-binding forkhead associated (FHA) protein
MFAPPAPAYAPASQYAPAPTTGAFDDDDDTDIEETRIVDRTRGNRFVLQFSTGESVSVSGTGLIGRHPIPEPGEYFDSFVAIIDPGKSVSKTHLEFGQDSGSFWVSDRYSGNGTIVREPERQARRCEPGKRYRIVRGTRVDIGEQFFIVS